jgi:cell division protease FtsH
MARQRGEAEHQVAELLRTAKEALGLSVAFLTRMDGTHQHLEVVDSAIPFLFREGVSLPQETTFCQAILDGRLPAVIPDVREPPAAMALPAARFPRLRSYVSVPVTLSDGTFYGTFCAAGLTSDKGLTVRDKALLGVLASAAAVIIEPGVLARERRDEIEARLLPVLDGDGPTVLLRPIVETATGRRVGAEALSRFPAAWGLTPDVVFAQAHSVGLGDRLELLALERAAVHLDAVTGYVAMNVSPQTLLTDGCAEPLARLPADRVLLELSEHDPVEDYDALWAALAGPRAAGMRLAIDDVGAGFSSLRHIVLCAPGPRALDARRGARRVRTRQRHARRRREGRDRTRRGVAAAARRRPRAGLVLRAPRTGLGARGRGRLPARGRSVPPRTGESVGISPCGRRSPHGSPRPTDVRGMTPDELSTTAPATTAPTGAGPGTTGAHPAPAATTTATTTGAPRPDRGTGPGEDRSDLRAPRRLRRPTRREALVGGGVAMLLLAGTAAVVAGTHATATEPPRTVSLTTALTTIEDGRVRSASLDDAASEVTLVLRDGVTTRAAFPAAYADEMTDALVDADVALDTTAGGPGAGEVVAQRVVPVLLVLALLVVLVKVLNPDVARSGKKKALTSGEIPDVTFADVAGADEAVDQLREMVQFLREPERFEAVGATRPRGALLVGPPGTGKTLLARAVAGEADVPFFALAGSDFVETYVGVGARRVRDLFAQARKAERAIIFIDEIDAVGRARSGKAGSGSDGERENTLISLLNEMDGFAGSQIIVLAATNRADILDAALTRPGRLDREVHVPNPDRRGRSLILEVHGRSRPLAGDVDLVQVARQTPGMSGADLAQVVNEACMEAARRGQPLVDAACFQAAVATVAMGRARTSALVTDHDRRITAWHEAGHTLAAALLPDADDPVSVTIVPRGPAGGVTWMSGSDDIFLPRKKALAQLVVAMAGRAAEERLLDGEYTQGASGDLQSATSLATSMVTQYGMTGFGYAQIDADTMRVGGEVAARAHAHVDELLHDAHRDATALLAEHAALLEALATALLLDETLSGSQVFAIVAEHVALDGVAAA